MFITFEGPEGSGKTSVMNEVFEKLSKENYEIIKTREPGGTPIAEQIRDIILNKENTALDPRAEALLYAASRRQHLVEKIIPAMKEGKIIFCDRFLDSSLAYQGGGRGLGVENILNVNLFATEGLWPDYTLIFNIKPEDGLKRIAANKGREVNRLDLEKLDFHNKVYETFMNLAKSDPNRYIIIDATKPYEEVVDEVYTTIKKLISK